MLVSSRFSRSIGRPAGTCLRRKRNHCHTAIALGDKKQAKMGSVFAPHFLTVHSKTAPKRGPYFGPRFGTKTGMGVQKFCGPISVLGRHRRRRQDILGRQTSEGYNPVFSKSLHPFLRRCTSRRRSHERHTFKTYRSPAVYVLGSVSEPGHLPHMEAWS